MLARLEEMQLHNLIRLSELPLLGKIRVVYQSIGKKPQASLSGRRYGRPENISGGGRNTKCRMSFEQLDVGKDLSQWKKPEHEATSTTSTSRSPVISLTLSNILKNMWLKPCNNSITDVGFTLVIYKCSAESSYAHVTSKNITRMNLHTSNS